MAITTKATEEMQTSPVLLTEDEKMLVRDALAMKRKSVERAVASEVNQAVVKLRRLQLDELLALQGRFV